MPEFRQNIATKEWVIISSERAKRPNSYVQSTESVNITQDQAFEPNCPFCVGNEERDLELDAIPREGDWQVRAVLNKYPALSPHEPLERSFDGVRRYISGLGQHEVIVEHPVHNTTLALMQPSEIEKVMELFSMRGWYLREDQRIEQIIYFKNHGVRPGASLVHPHSQIIALPVVPHNIRQRTEEARRYFDDTGDCVFCVMLADEIIRQDRIVAQTDHFVAFVLYAAYSPFHTWIVPKRHGVSFLYMNAAERSDLALIIKQVLHRIYVGLNDPAYNMVVQSSPTKEIGNNYLHWYISVVPRLTRQAGFELGSGMYINTSLPEDCADFLRQVEL
jgi:UDPglucose--hexose-1-phosphate uridylyltransferase